MLTIRKPTHPGKAFRVLILEELKISVEKAAKTMGVDCEELQKVLNEESNLSVEMAKSWGVFTNKTHGSWANMQIKLNEWHARQK